MSTKKYHITKDGTKILIKDLENGHLRNILNMLKRIAKEGLTIRYGGMGVDVDELWYDEEIIYGQEALNKMNYHAYEEEWERRQKKLTEEDTQNKLNDKNNSLNDIPF